MTFIAEKMPEEAKEKLPFQVNAEYDGSKPTLWKWAVDKENDAFIVLVGTLGGSYSGTEVKHAYVLYLQGSLTSIFATPKQRTYTEDGLTMVWQIDSIDRHQDSQISVAELLPVIVDAFKVVGEFFDGHKFLHIAVILPEPEYITSGIVSWT